MYEVDIGHDNPAPAGGERQSSPSKEVKQPRRILRMKEVMGLTGIQNRETLRQLERADKFPRRFALTPGLDPNDRWCAKGWFEDEVLAWIEARGESRNGS